ncbi:MAG: bifunctional 5,10-methylenetetrahydrofolate dehydrogenase/5,10-methenyltetrahydrofolate cyclohydrolase [Candidatus Aminicenantes bacterium]|nr:bifunctional 5,10-methylenetetrahydrofolate dehydrogenase/5,10-methenyltetrahydrofolate cyclohydrolase [Candidatus Aminicenantes bacterium]
MAQVMEGKTLAEKIKAEVKAEVRRLQAESGQVPKLVGILVGENKASEIYLRTKEKTAQSLGIVSEIRRFPQSLSQEELIDQLRILNEAPEIDGLLVQLPLPPKFETNRVIEAISPEKDVDGFHPLNLGRLFMNEEGLRPCTPAGIIELLKFYGVSLEGQEVVIIGRSLIVGKPLAAMFINENSTVTICHSRTRNLAGIASRADILVAAMGRPAYVQPELVKEGAVVVDVGINYVSEASFIEKIFGDDPKKRQDLQEKGYTIVGDVHPAAREKASFYTPVPGGVGPLTVAMLMQNTLLAFKRRRQLG